MTKEQFNLLSDEAKNQVFEEMCELFSLIENYPISYAELEIFTKWHRSKGRFGEELKKLLIGICPSDEIEYARNQSQLEELLKLSDDVLYLVSFWNRVLRNEWANVK